VVAADRGERATAEVKRPLAGRAAPTKRLPSGVALSYTSDNSSSTKEKEMRKAIMSIQPVVAKDMTRNAHLELGDFGACRRR